MNLERLQQQLLAAARAHPPSDRVPYAFAQRIRAQLEVRSRPDVWALWGGALWRAAASCIGLVLLLGAYTLLSPSGNGSTGDLSQELENTVLAAANQEQIVDSTW